jgi:DNA-binding NarL/FixJ family response regulator
MVPSQSVTAEVASRGRILLVDDEPVFLSSTALLLEELGYSCTCASTATAAFAAASSGGFDVLICDLIMNGRSQLDLMRRIAALPEAPAVILVTGHPSVETAVTALDLGLVAYVLKPFEIGELLQRIDVAIQRRTWTTLVDRAKASLDFAAHGIDQLARMVQTGRAPTPQRPDSSGAEFGDLTRRERELVAELLQGYRVSTIARRLRISPHTVRRHLKNIFLKLEVGSQAELLEKLRP